MAEHERRRKATRDLPDNMESLMKRMAVLEEQLDHDGERNEKKGSSTDGDDNDEIEEA